MAHRDILIDTSVVIDFLRKKKKNRSLLWRLRENYNCFMSVITVFELFAGAVNEQKTQDIQKIIKWIEAILLDSKIAELSAQFYRDLKHRNEEIEFRDIFIGATAIFNGFPLATLNRKHFIRLPGILLLDNEMVVGNAGSKSDKSAE